MSTTEVTNTPIQDLQMLIKNLPQDATWEDIEYAIYVVQKIRKGQAEVRSGKTFTTDEVREKLKQWLK